MTTAEGVAKIKKLLFGDVPPVPAPPVPAPAAMATDYTLADGTTVVSIDKLEVGGMVTIAGAAAPDATITLADGTQVTTVAGSITAIVPMEVEETPVELAMQKVIAEAIQKFAASEKVSRDQAAEANQAIFNKHNEAFTQIVKMLEKFGETETVKPEEPAKDWDKMTALEKFRATK